MENYLIILVIIILFIFESDIRNLIKCIQKDRINKKRTKIGIDLEICNSIINEVGDILNKYHIPFMLAEGTALGVHRDGSLIKCDSDIDLSYPSTHYDVFLKKVKPELELRGYQVGIGRGTNYFNNRYNFAIKNDHYIDFDIIEENKNCFAKWGRSCNELIPHLKNPRKINWNNRIWKIPGESYYEYLYGQDWKIPQCGKKPPKK